LIAIAASPQVEHTTAYRDRDDSASPDEETGDGGTRT